MVVIRRAATMFMRYSTAYRYVKSFKTIMLLDQCLLISLTGVLQICIFIKPKAAFDLHLFICVWFTEDALSKSHSVK